MKTVYYILLALVLCYGCKTKDSTDSALEINIDNLPRNIFVLETAMDKELIKYYSNYLQDTIFSENTRRIFINKRSENNKRYEKAKTIRKNFLLLDGIHTGQQSGSAIYMVPKVKILFDAMEKAFDSDSIDTKHISDRIFIGRWNRVGDSVNIMLESNKNGSIGIDGMLKRKNGQIAGIYFQYVTLPKQERLSAGAVGTDIKVPVNQILSYDQEDNQGIWFQRLRDDELFYFVKDKDTTLVTTLTVTNDMRLRFHNTADRNKSILKGRY